MELNWRETLEWESSYLLLFSETLIDVTARLFFHRLQFVVVNGYITTYQYETTEMNVTTDSNDILSVCKYLHAEKNLSNRTNSAN